MNPVSKNQMAAWRIVVMQMKICAVNFVGYFASEIKRFYFVTFGVTRFEFNTAKLKSRVRARCYSTFWFSLLTAQGQFVVITSLPYSLTKVSNKQSSA
jgi:hypothetical protein